MQQLSPESEGIWGIDQEEEPDNLGEAMNMFYILIIVVVYTNVYICQYSCYGLNCVPTKFICLSAPVP